MPSQNKPGKTSGRTAAPPDKPVHHNRRLRVAVTIGCILMIALAAGFVVYRVAFNTVEAVPEPQFDLSSLMLKGRTAQPGDPASPAIEIQKHLELLREKKYADAYKDLSANLQDITSLEQFKYNAGLNQPLFRDVSSYSFPTFEVQGDTAQLSGLVRYDNGGQSAVTASFVREGGRWKVAVLTMVYQ